MARVDLLQLVINASAVMGISLCWIAFSDKASKKIWNLAFETFWSPHCSDDEEEEEEEEEEIHPPPYTASAA